MIEEVLKAPNELLRKVSKEVTLFDDSLKGLADVMIDTMYVQDGVGLAAPQIGVLQRLVLVDPSGGDDSTQLLVMVNPKIDRTDGKQVSNEGCLSMPGVRGDVDRAMEVDVSFFDLNGQKYQRTFAGFVSAIVQHEIDHLDGVLFTDRIRGIKKLGIRKTT